MHGDIAQNQREVTLKRFKERKFNVLVATDVAARGIDIPDVDLVIQVEPPKDPETYIHRSGRTARAGKSGISSVLVTPREASRIKQIEKIIKRKFDKCLVPEGKEICEKQLFNMIEEIKSSEVDQSEIEAYLPAIMDELQDFDKETLINGVKLVRKIYSSKPLSDFCEEETIPGKQISTDDQIIDYARKFGSTVYHPIGTCRMGNDPNSVVDLDLKVRGIKNLRVIDASIMPSMLSANLNAGTMMIAEKGADLILGKTPPEPIMLAQ